MHIRRIMMAIFFCGAGVIFAGDKPTLIYFTGLREIESAKDKPNTILQDKYPEAFNQWEIKQVTFAEAINNELHHHDSALYTKPAIHYAASELNDKKNKDVNADSKVEGIIGFSNGAGVLINLLAKLVTYDQNKDYWGQPTLEKTTANINSSVPMLNKTDAVAILQKVNSGFLVFDAPLLHARHFNSISTWSGRISMGLPTIGTPLAALCCMPFSWSLFAASAAVGALAGWIFKTPLKRAIGNIIVRNCISRTSDFKNFDPYHPSPLESVQQFKGKITCPVLIHFHEHDGILDGPGADAALFCSAFDENKTVICVTRDGKHTTMPSINFKACLKKFFAEKDNKNMSWSLAPYNSQPCGLYRPSEFKAIYGSVFD